MDDSAWIAFYRSEMVRVRDIFAGFGGMFRPAAILFLAGSTLGRTPLTYEPWPVLTVCAPLVIALWLNLDSAERFQQKIDQLDSTLERCGRQA